MGLMDWGFGGFGGQSLWSLESWGRGIVRFAMSMFWREGFCTIGDHGDQYLFSILWDVGCTEVGAGDLYFTTMVTSFLGFCVY